jgi:hypothetical protein
VHNLRGINFGATETPFEAVWRRFAGKTAIIPHLGLNNEIHFKDNREYMEHVLRTTTHTRGLCIIVTPGKTDMQAGAMTGFVEQVKGTLAGRGTSPHLREVPS